MNERYKDKEWLETKYLEELKDPKEIGKICNRDPMTIRYWLKKFNIHTRNFTEAHQIRIKKKKYSNKNWLYNQYITKEKSTSIIAKELNTSPTTIKRWLGIFKIPIRSSKEAIRLTFKKGRKIWCDGLTKENHNSLKIISEKLKGKNHPQWKGKDASRDAIHLWIEVRKIKPKSCEYCNKEKKLSLSFNHSLGNYTRNVEDYMWLCWKCHMKRDNYPRNELGQFIEGKVKEVLF